MLKYFKQPKNTVVFNKFAMFGSYGFASNLENIPDFDMFYKAEKNDLVHTTIIQHNGYLYYFKKMQNSQEITIQGSHHIVYAKAIDWRTGDRGSSLFA